MLSKKYYRDYGYSNIDTGTLNSEEKDVVLNEVIDTKEKEREKITI
jgi:hypothetical protein